MISKILQFLLLLVVQIANIILTIFLDPILGLFSAIFPSFSDASQIFNTFLIQYAAPGIAFARELFLNITGYPRALLTTLALIYAAKITFHLSIIPVKFALRLVSYIFHLPITVNKGNDYVGSN